MNRFISRAVGLMPMMVRTTLAAGILACALIGGAAAEEAPASLQQQVDGLATAVRTLQDRNYGTATQMTQLAAIAHVVFQLQENVAVAGPEADPGEAAFLADELASLQNQYTALKQQMAGFLPGAGPSFEVRTMRPTFQQFAAGRGNFQLRPPSRIVIDSEDPAFITALAAPMSWVQKLRYATGLKLDVVSKVTPEPGDIVLSGKPDRKLTDMAEIAINTWDKNVRPGVNGNPAWEANAGLGSEWNTRPWIADSVPLKDNILNEGYTYKADADNVTLTYKSNLGAIHSLQTLYQLLASDRRAPGNHRWLPGGEGLDYPLGDFRGLMIDVGRKFVSVENIIGIMDKMSLYKMNMMHLHLSDHAKDNQNNWHGFLRLYDDSLSDEMKKLKPSDGLYYTKADIKRIEAAAAAYGIEILPEIDLPGHARAFLAVHPEFGIAGAQGEFDAATIDIANPAAKQYIKDMLPEFAAFFTSGKWHFGADEVGNTNAQTLAQFVNEMYTDLKDKIGPRMFGVWSGALTEPSVNNNVTIFDWTDEPRADLAGKKFVNLNDLYFVPFTQGFQVSGEIKDGWPYTTYRKLAGRNSGIPSGREIAIWNDRAMMVNYGFEAMNAGVRLALPSHAYVTWNGLSFDQNSRYVPYASLPAFNTSVSHEQSSYWLRDKFPSLSGADALKILLETASFRHISHTAITTVKPADRAKETASDPLGWDPLDMQEAFKKAEELVKAQTFQKTGVLHLQ